MKFKYMFCEKQTAYNDESEFVEKNIVTLK